MSRIVNVAGLGLFGLLSVIGCKNLAETKTITEFTRSLQSEDIDGLRSISSQQFGEHALRSAEALDDLKLLRLPEEKPTIVKVEEVDRDTKRVTVEVGDTGRHVFYELVREVYDGPWRVNEIYLQQKKKGVVAHKSVSEQINLLLSVREFYESWSRGDREDLLATCAPELREQLQSLPPAYLARLSRQVAQPRSENSTFQPTAQMDDDIAVVRIPRAAGSTVVTLAAAGEKWFATDIALDAKQESERIPSVLKLTRAGSVGLSFLAAYNAGDKKLLEELSTRNFYNGALSVGDLSEVPLPSGDGTGYEFEIQLLGSAADLVLTTPAELIRVSLQSPDGKDAKLPQYRVSDVTIYDLEDKQQRRLSAIFTAQGMMHLFATALHERDLDMLRHSSTPDFNSRVWENFDEETLKTFPLELGETVPERTISTEFQGSLTEITVTQGERALTYVLREHLGRFFVDDVIVPLDRRPTSYKQNLELLMPVVAFHRAFLKGTVSDLQPVSSKDLNTIIWSQFELVPDSGFQVGANLDHPVAAIEKGESNAVVTLGNAHHGARILLVRERDRWLVDELLLINGVEPELRKRYKHEIRAQLAEGRYRRDPESKKIQHVSLKTAEGGDTEGRRPPRRLNDPEADARALDRSGDSVEQRAPRDEIEREPGLEAPPAAGGDAEPEPSDIDREMQLLDRLDLPTQSEPGQE